MLALVIPFLYGIPECQRTQLARDVPCNIISSWSPSEECSSYIIDFYNESGIIVQSQNWSDYTPLCNTTFNITTLGTYVYNSTVEDGIITIEGEKDNMILSITLFLLLVNIAVFILPFKVDFHHSKAANYVIKRLIWIGGIFILWFNMTLFWSLSESNGLGIGTYMQTYWIIFTMACLFMTFVIVYVMLVGSLKLIKEVKMRERMGGNDDIGDGY